MTVSTQNSELRTQTFSKIALPVCLSAMDACWIYTVAWLFASTALEKVATLPLPSPVVLAGVALAGWGIAAFLLDRTTLPTWLVQSVAMLAGVELSIAIMAVLSPPGPEGPSVRWLVEGVAGISLSFILWVRGLYRAAGRPAFNEIYSDFQLGLAVLVLGALIAPFFANARFGAIWTEVATLPVWFFIFGLVALALGNREVVRQEIGAAAGSSWGIVLAGSVGIIVVIGTLSALFGGPNLLTVVQQVAAAVIVAITGAIYGIIFAVLWLWYILLKPKLEPLKFQGTPTPNTTQDQTFEEFLRRLRAQEREQDLMAIPAEWVQLGVWVAAILVGAVALWLVSLGLRRYFKRPPPNATEERERLGSWELFWQQLRGLLTRLLARFRPKAAVEAHAGEDDLASLSGRPEWSGTLSVRQIYARLLTLAGKVGYPRSPHQTPVEYLGVLAEAMPNLRDDFRAITAAYLEARYGPLPASSPAVLSATNAWGRAEPEMMRGMREDGRRTTDDGRRTTDDRRQ
ncbi:MAG TPA: DUF4129 domain-containing protein [Chloroflexia bacterium]|nr:DUF4129 domain-containing protein [Chloroflexia bacterium]